MLHLPPRPCSRRTRRRRPGGARTTSGLNPGTRLGTLPRARPTLRSVHHHLLLRRPPPCPSTSERLDHHSSPPSLHLSVCATPPTSRSRHLFPRETGPCRFQPYVAAICIAKRCCSTAAVWLAMPATLDGH